ncbi:MAG TPA: hypothetical protein VMC62_04385 [Longilinea sp.]|nr:hypothetical protein [Longilinea sp.]
MDGNSQSLLKRIAGLHWGRLLLWAAWGAVGLLLAIGAGFMLSYGMNNHPWAYSDSVEYIVTARHLLAGQGLTMPAPDGHLMSLSLHPPFYPLTLAGLFLLGGNTFTSIAWLNIILFAGAVLILFAGLLWTTRSFWYALTVSLLFPLIPALVKNFDGAMSEPLFTFLLVASYMTLVGYFVSRKPGWLIASGLLAFLATLTRFAGAAAIIAGTLATLLWAGKTWRRKFKMVGIYLASSALPFLIWGGITYLQSGSFASRSVIVPAQIPQLLTNFRTTVIEIWVSWLPYTNVAFQTWHEKSLTVYVTILLTGIIALRLAWGWQRTIEWHRDKYLPGMLAALGNAILYFGCYMLVLLVSYLFSSLTPDINERMLAPSVPFMLLACFGALFALLRFWRWKPVFVVIPLALAAFLINAYWPLAQKALQDNRFGNLSYSAPQWDTSGVFQDIQSLSAQQPLFSNDPALVLLHTDRFPYALSEISNQVTLANPLPYGQGKSSDEALFDQKGGALVLFKDTIYEQFHGMYGDGTDERIALLTKGLSAIYNDPYSSIYVK